MSVPVREASAAPPQQPPSTCDLRGPASLDAAAEAAIDVAKAAARFASDAFDFVTKPLTDAINGQIDKLGPGDSYKVAVGGGANIRAVGLSDEAQLQIERGADGGYTVALAGEIEADVAKKLKLPLTLGADGRVEFKFDSVEDAKRAVEAGTLQTSALAPGALERRAFES